MWRICLGFCAAHDVRGTAQSWEVSQPPPYRRPGPSEARKIGRRSWRACFEALRKASCRAAPHVDEPRLPDTRATGGKVLKQTPHCLASRATRRGFGWRVAKPPAEPRGMLLRNSTETINFSRRAYGEP